MKYPAYPRYKPSGVEWLGDVPEHWDIKKLRHIVYRRDHKVEADESRPLPYIGMEHVESWTGKLLPLDENLVPNGISNHFQKGDLLFGKLRPYLAKACMAGFEGLCSSEFLVLQPRYNHKFLLYQLLSSGFISTVDSSTYGAKMPRASWEFIGSCWLTCPSFEEQCAIANFLDAQTAKIDTLLAKKRKLIEKLKEKRTALISRTVTCGLPPEAARAAGLDPSPNLKSSGVDWLCDVPEHWEVKRLKHVASINDEVLSETTDPDYELLYVDISSVDAQRGITSMEEITFDNAPSRARRIVRDGDIIVSTVRTYLQAIAPILKPKGNLIVSTGFAVIRPRTIEPRFLAYALKEARFIETIMALSVGVSYPAINALDIGTIVVPVPPREEQLLIADFLDHEMIKIDQMVNKIDIAIRNLQDYRSALITAAVTGKIDVREATA